MRGLRRGSQDEAFWRRPVALEMMKELGSEPDRSIADPCPVAVQLVVDGLPWSGCGCHSMS